MTPAKDPPRASALPARDPTAAPTLGDAAKVAGWGVVFWGAAQFAATVFARNATAVVAVQAALSEWGAGRMAIAWSDPLADEPSWQMVGRRAGIGAAAGAVLALVLTGLAVILHAAVAAERVFAPGLLGIGLVVSLLGAVRDELLLRGVVLRATRGLLPWWAALVSCGACAAAARYGLEGAVGLALVFDALKGMALGAIWLGDRGAWMAVGASAAWSWTLGSVVRGGLLDVRFVTEPDGWTVGLVVMAGAAVACAAWAWRRVGREARPL
jgi:hypothetical protein